MYLPDQNGRPQNNGPDLLAVREVAKRIRVSTRTVWRLLKTKKLPYPIRIGGSVRWTKAGIESWLEAGCPPQS